MIGFIFRAVSFVDLLFSVYCLLAIAVCCVCCLFAAFSFLISAICHFVFVSCPFLCFNLSCDLTDALLCLFVLRVVPCIYSKYLKLVVMLSYLPAYPK